MKNYISVPHPALQPFISTIGFIDYSFGTYGLSPLQHYPCSSQVRLCFYLNSRLSVKKDDHTCFARLPTAFIVGPQLTGTWLNFADHTVSGTVVFTPGGFRRFTGIPASELVNRETEAAFLFGSEIYRLEDRLGQTQDLPTLMRLTEDFLCARIPHAHKTDGFDHAIARLVSRHGNISIEQAASQACLSLRQFERQCYHRLGLSPKLFARLIRFSKAYTLKETHPHLPWTDITHRLGYHDQMHLIRDFRTFAGYTPSTVNHYLNPSLGLVNLLEGGNPATG